MKRQIQIVAGKVDARAEMNGTKTAEAIWQALPLKSKAETWGDEVYFEIPIKLDLEDGKELVAAGDLGYWPTGACFCIFFGPTPMSKGNEIRPASAVNVFGKVIGDPKVFKKVRDGEAILIESA
jgi:uncharacterized protein